MNEQIRTHAEAFQLLLSGYQKSRILISAVSAGIFEALAGARLLSVEEIALATHTAPRPLRIVLDALTGMGLLEKRGELYFSSPDAREFLEPGSPYFMGDIALHHDNLWYSWSTLDTVLRSGERVPRDKVAFPYPPDVRNRHFIQGMKNLAALSLPAILEGLDLGGRTHILDLGGGPASHSIAFCRKWPHLQATVFDTPDGVRIGHENVKEAGLEGRIHFLEGDFLTDPLGDGYDVVFISSIIHMFDDDTNRHLISRCAQTLDPGGLLAVKDMFVDEERTGPLQNLLFAVNMLVGTEGGDTYPRSRVQSWFESAGLEPVPGEIALDPRTSILRALRPGGRP